ncbi:hypothetical protein [Aquella oligotrophica]|uniref:Lipoprotein n=1 Tax=Aquella oligotrophica TaxID=2067065 RepID=A0A2I7N924_9NEIS|nr:hypothetical protein [Aquella oligotrophica]AUR52958.1 hypothetical protein CUN60_11845 [Aquella oligotrophica]
MKNISNYFILLSILVLVACSSGITSTNQAEYVQGEVDVSNSLVLDDFGVLPILQESASYILRINNYSNQRYSLTSVRVTNVKDLLDQSNLLKVNTIDCTKLAAASKCNLKLTPQANRSVDVVLTVKLEDEYSNFHTLRKLIRMSNKISFQNGVNFVGDFGKVVTTDGRYNIAIPLAIRGEFDEFKNNGGQIICESNKSEQRGGCTYLLSGYVESSTLKFIASVSGFNGGILRSSASESLTVVKGEYSNLLISHGLTIDRAKGVNHVYTTLWNSGNVSAYKININLGNNLAIYESIHIENIEPSQRENALINVIGVSAIKDMTGKSNLNIEYFGKEQKFNANTTIYYVGQNDHGDGVGTITNPVDPCFIDNSCPLPFKGTFGVDDVLISTIKYPQNAEEHDPSIKDSYKFVWEIDVKDMDVFEAEEKIYPYVVTPIVGGNTILPEVLDSKGCTIKEKNDKCTIKIEFDPRADSYAVGMEIKGRLELKVSFEEKYQSFSASVPVKFYNFLANNQPVQIRTENNGDNLDIHVKLTYITPTGKEDVMRFPTEGVIEPWKRGEIFIPLWVRNPKLEFIKTCGHGCGEFVTATRDTNWIYGDVDENEPLSSIIDDYGMHLYFNSINNNIRYMCINFYGRDPQNRDCGII